MPLVLHLREELPKIPAALGMQQRERKQLCYEWVVTLGNPRAIKCEPELERGALRPAGATGRCRSQSGIQPGGRDDG